MSYSDNVVKIVTRKHNIQTMEDLEKRTLRKMQKFNEDFNSTNTDISHVDYKIVNDYILIKCEHVKSDDVEFKHTKIFDLKNKFVICISGLNTLNIDDLPLYIISF